MKAEDLAWACGLLEGEGCFSLHVRKSGPQAGRVEAAIHCEMTDADVVRRLALVFVGLGTVCQRPARTNRKPTWIWSVQRKAAIRTVLNYIEPHMGLRRREQINKILDQVGRNES